MKQKKQVVMLPTTEASQLYIDNGYKNRKHNLFYDEIAMVDDLDPKANQYIYFLSDEEIKEGDWCFDIKLKRIFRISDNDINAEAGGIDEVTLEYEEEAIYIGYSHAFKKEHGIIDKLKLNDDNTVIWSLEELNRTEYHKYTISKEIEQVQETTIIREKMYSKEEVETLFELHRIEFINKSVLGSGMLTQERNQDWIKDNLK